MTKPEQSPIQPLALMGGTFDPVHFGHLRCAEEARQKLGLDRLYLLPAGTPPHRGTPRASVRQRLDMLELARSEFPRLEIDDRETRRSGPSYMVDTLEELRDAYPRTPLCMLLGQDAANYLHTWFHWERLFELANIVILTRPGTLMEYSWELEKHIRPRSGLDVRELHTSLAGTVLHLEVESIDISASGIKKIIRSGGSPASMMPAAVFEYIRKNRLYLTD